MCQNMEHFYITYVQAHLDWFHLERCEYSVVLKLEVWKNSSQNGVWLSSTIVSSLPFSTSTVKETRFPERAV